MTDNPKTQYTGITTQQAIQNLHAFLSIIAQDKETTETLTDQEWENTKQLIGLDDDAE